MKKLKLWKRKLTNFVSEVSDLMIKNGRINN